MPNLFPQSETFETVELKNNEDELELKGSFLFDFEKGEFVKNADGTLKRCNKVEAYKQWCQKAILTPRYKRSAYSSIYGSEIKDLIASNLSQNAKELEITRLIKETILVHPYTKEVGEFSFNWLENSRLVEYEFDVLTIDDENIVIDGNIKR
ncbi:TPA: DUF2634 domain-containing protein [Clostridioides difficile]|uniref:DUF2634 domain-containing protein n=1 Tax=Clostridioides difficile TaxID=1496 RepID=UPI00093D8E8D|nr:DUF2634 domain-containing protein [Clostridioides difficile]EGT3757677.1 DUF2634 domain-containing protein [Clostridioides difficile]EGT4159421.1 DUF2634 domain-containing protein [Clostridioides difficile]EGT4635087.1 DUF2634 domain-containing protein [Clostridioides difficile]EGT4831753.1 DUF2634 domain-containing protein [Clostridioides difficile]EII6777339.1 DUF2634 domain-containing protein [Clostridioides difficile]